MDVEEVDPISGRKTTGHEWNGLTELDTPVPRGILLFLVITHLFALIWWVLLPTWPLGATYTKGLLGIDQRNVLKENLAQAAAARAVWEKKIDTLSYDQIQADPGLMAIVRSTGHQLFGDNCAACHRADATGGHNYPNLTDNDWLWGGGPDNIAETVRVGINSQNPDSRVAQMPAFGRDQMLEPNQVRDVVAYVYSLSNPASATPDNASQIAAGKEVFLTTCAACHGDDAKGKQDVGAPNLTDAVWLYGGDLGSIYTTVYGGRQGHMPTWEARLTPAEIKILALYVNSLGAENP